MSGTATGVSFNGMTGLSSANPQPPGIADPGIATTVARGDHVHPAGSPGPVSPVMITVGDTALASGQPYRLVLGFAEPITSLDVDTPFVDGITLESGGIGSSIKAGNLGQGVFHTAAPLPSGDVFYLAQNGKMTSTVPDSLSGDLWQVAVARKIDSMHFVFTPQEPIALS